MLFKPYLGGYQSFSVGGEQHRLERRVGAFGVKFENVSLEQRRLPDCRPRGGNALR
jgi:hypothetical protein